MEGLVKTAGLFDGIKHFAGDVTGKNAEVARQEMLAALRQEADGVVSPKVLSQKIRESLRANDQRFLARRRLAAGGVGGLMAGGIGIGMAAHKKKDE